MGGSLCVFILLFKPAADCEQSKALALGKMLVRCRWQMKDKYFGAAVEKIEDQRKPEDFIGHRKPAAKPKMPQVHRPIQSIFCYKLKFNIYRGVAQLVARLVWDQDAAGSNPVISTT